MTRSTTCHSGEQQLRMSPDSACSGLPALEPQRIASERPAHPSGASTARFCAPASSSAQLDVQGS